MTAALIVAACIVLAVLCVAMAVILDSPKSRGAGTAFPSSREGGVEPSTSGRTPGVLRPGTDRQTLRSKCHP